MVSKRPTQSFQAKALINVPQVNKDSEQTPHLSVRQHGDLVK